jgi:hypothetical protein
MAADQTKKVDDFEALVDLTLAILDRDDLDSEERFLAEQLYDNANKLNSKLDLDLSESDDGQY